MKALIPNVEAALWQPLFSLTLSLDEGRRRKMNT
jgi:hypothetical protein